MVSFRQVSPPKPCIHLFSPIRAKCHHLILLDFINRTILAQQYRSLSSSICSFLLSPVTSSILLSNIPLNTLFSNILSLHSFLNVSHQFSRPYNHHQRTTPETHVQTELSTRRMPCLIFSSEFIRICCSPCLSATR